MGGPPPSMSRSFACVDCGGRSGALRQSLNQRPSADAGYHHALFLEVPTRTQLGCEHGRIDLRIRHREDRRRGQTTLHADELVGVDHELRAEEFVGLPLEDVREQVVHHVRRLCRPAAPHEQRPSRTEQRVLHRSAGAPLLRLRAELQLVGLVATPLVDVEHHLRAGSCSARNVGPSAPVHYVRDVLVLDPHVIAGDPRPLRLNDVCVVEHYASVDDEGALGAKDHLQRADEHSQWVLLVDHLEHDVAGPQVAASHRFHSVPLQDRAIPCGMSRHGMTSAPPGCSISRGPTRRPETGSPQQSRLNRITAQTAHAVEDKKLLFSIQM